MDLEDRIRVDARALAHDELGVDDSGVVNGFVWVAYPGVSRSIHVHVFPRPIVAAKFFSQVEDSIRSRLSKRPSRGVRTAPSLSAAQYVKRPDAAYLSMEVLAHDVRDAEVASREERTGTSRIFDHAPPGLTSYSFDPDEIDSLVPKHGSRRGYVGVEGFVRIDRFGSKDPGDLDLLLDPNEALENPQVRIKQGSPRGFVMSIVRDGFFREYRLRRVELTRSGLVDDHWYVDTLDVLRNLRAYARR